MDGALDGIDPILCGEMTSPHAYVFRSSGGGALARVAAVLRPGGEQVPMPLLAFVLRHPSAGSILVDTGLHPDALADLRGDFGTPMGLLFRSLRPAGQPFDEQLRGLGVDPRTSTSS